MAGDVRVQAGDEFTSDLRLVLDVLKLLECFHGHHGLELESLGGAEFSQQTIRQRNFTLLVDDGFALLERHGEVAVFLHLPLGDLQPFLPIIRDDIRHEHLLDLIQRSAPIVALDDELDQVEVMQRSHLAQPLDVADFAGENVVFVDGLEALGGEPEVHVMAGLAMEIDGEPGKNRIDRLDAAQAPTAVGAESALGELHERLDVRDLDFSRQGQFVELVFHKAINLDWN